MDFFKLQTSHTSVRSFQNKPISDELKKQLITAAQSGSSSNFVQAYSIIEIQNNEKLNEIAEIANGNYFIPKSGAFYIFVTDLHRNYQIAKTTNEDFAAFTSMESLIVSIVDTTIAAQNMATYAESQGLGICYIGGIRNEIFRIAEILDLPSYTVPLFGMTVGYPSKKNDVKPRLPKAVILHTDSYQNSSETAIDDYDKTTREYYHARANNNQEASWSKKVQEHFALDKRPQVAKFLKQKGFHY
ncbi:MAG: oxygen-insensitive NADPH nitroreductase [Micrococcaceae bacterium]